MSRIRRARVRALGMCMRVVWFTATALLAVVGVARPVAAQSLTLENALAQARTRAPEVLAAIARVDEARARLIGAGLRFREDPVVDLDIGPRWGAGRQTLDYSTGFSQLFETGGQRGNRMAAANAGIASAQASADETARVVVRAVAFAYVRATAADERVRLLTAAETVAEQLRAATDRRYLVGDVAALDLNLTAIAAARARADRIRAEAERDDALRPLRTALGLTPSAQVVLADGLERRPATESILLAAIQQTPAVRRADADVAQARAELNLGLGLKRPDLAPRVAISREQDDHIVLGGLSITLPLANRGQELTADANARIRRLTQERAATLQALQVDVETGLATYAQKRSAADVLRDVAMPAATDNETLAARSLDAGEMNLLNFLLVRQDVTTTRLSYVDALTDAALAAIEVDATAGVLR